MMKAANLFLGAVLGALVGSTVALLLTPMSGDELRTEVKSYTRHMKDEVEKAANARRAELERELANMRGEVITS